MCDACSVAHLQMLPVKSSHEQSLLMRSMTASPSLRRTCFTILQYGGSCSLHELSAYRTNGVRSSLKTGTTVNSTNALPCFGFSGCNCGHFGRSADLVARLLVKLGFCRIRFWYLVALGSGIFREICRIYFWNLTAEAIPGVADPIKESLMYAGAMNSPANLFVPPIRT